MSRSDAFLARSARDGWRLGDLKVELAARRGGDDARQDCKGGIDEVELGRYWRGVVWRTEGREASAKLEIRAKRNKLQLRARDLGSFSIQRHGKAIKVRKENPAKRTNVLASAL